MAFAFEKLQVYQKSIAFADNICTLTRDLPRGYFFLADQISRASPSIATNLAEGNGRFTKPTANTSSPLPAARKRRAFSFWGCELRYASTG